MSRVYALAALALLCVAVVVGCGKKDDQEPSSETANKEEALKRLNQIGAAMSRHWGVYSVGIFGPNERLGLSWRVALLPALGEEDLYKQFKLNEPWDSEHNKQLIAKMPKVFASPGKDAGVGKTYLRSFAGPKAFIPMLPGGSGRSVILTLSLPGRIAQRGGK
jgi:hypothetical protein